MIPLSILLRTGQYDIQIAEKTVRVVVRDSAVSVSFCVDNGLIPKLAKKSPVVGLDLHSSKNGRGGRSTNSLLVLCIDDYCLVVQLKHVDKIPDNLRRFLADEKICFVGVDIDRKLSRGVPSPLSPLVCKTAVELSHLAARIRKEPSLLNDDIKALAKKVGVAKEVGISDEPADSGGSRDPRDNYEAKVFSGDELEALVFSEKEVKALALDAYVCYNIGRRLVEELLRDSSAPSSCCFFNMSITNIIKKKKCLN
ncbi:hypothetical protein Nepgr_029906 [Nepenthes gracilis]|uniref:3'-5' exonuclease domain-containing protein n=1 Tax=Nepenthes gracilis TaxID=150966 RepID=A0AAD3Y3N7_NEPGR|nr:hypothetical protein Nepgr_029906 [Nepenthes gracilis]